MKNVKIQNAETIQSYFTRVSQIKEQLEAVDEEVENEKIEMTTLNGLLRSWDYFIQGIIARKNLVKFSRLWEECSQEEDQIATRKEKMVSEDQALTVLSRMGRRKNHHHQGKHSHQKSNHVRRDPSKIRCYTCDEI